MKSVTLNNAEHYIWGEGCDGWHLLKGDDLSVIQERVPPGNFETKHLLIFDSHKDFRSIRIEAIARPRFGHNVSRMLRVAFNFVAQLIDKNAQVFDLLGRLPTPDGLRQGAMGDNFPRIADQVFQNLELLRRELDLSSGRRH
jgi:hypothetical protein